MADLIELDVVVRDKTIKQSISTVSRLERELTKAAKAIEENRISQDRYNKILLSAKREYQALGLSSQKATASVRKFANEQRRLATTTDTVQKEVQQTTTAINNHVKSVNSAAAAMNRQTQAAQKGSKGLKQFASIGLQQVGYQVSDFMVQVQGGTNALVAFGQQGSQLAGLLFFLPGLFGAIAGSVVSIAIPAFTAFGNLLLNLGGKSKDLEETVSQLDQAFNSLDNANVLDYFGKLNDQVDISISKFRGLLELQREVAREQRAEAFTGLIETFAPLEDINTLQTEISRITELANEAGLETNETIERLNKKLSDQKTIREELLKIEGDTREESARNLSQVIENLSAQKLLSPELRRQLDVLADQLGLYTAANQQVEKTKDATVDAADEADKLREIASSISFDGATSSAAALAEMLGVAKDEAIALDATLNRAAGIDTSKDPRLTPFGTPGGGAFGSFTGAGGQLGFSGNFGPDKGKFIVDSSASRARAGGGGGVSEIEKLQKAYDNLRASVDDTFASQQKFNEAQDTLNKALKAGIISGKEYDKVLEMIRKEYGQVQQGAKSLSQIAGEAFEEAYVTAEEYNDLLKNEMVQGIESVSGAFTDFIMDGFRNFEDFADAIKATFRNLIATLIQTAVQNQIVIPIVASVTGGGGGLGGLLGGGGGGGGLLGNLGGGGGGLVGSLLGTGGGGLAGLAGSGGITGAIGSVASGVSGVLSGGGLGSSFANLGGLISGSAGGLGAIGAALPAVGVIAAGVGLISKAFKKQTESWEVIVGNISKLDAKIEKFGMIKSYNMFSSDVDYYTAPVEEGVFASFLQGVRQVQQGAMDAAATLGISADAFNNFVFQIDPYAKSLTDEIVRMGDAFAALVPGVSNLNELLAVANERYNLNTRLLQLQGNEEELIRRQREQELAVVHPLNRATLERIYALEDELRQQQQMQQKLQEIDQLGQRNLQDAERAVRDAFNALRESIRRVVDDLRIKLRAANDTLQNSQRLFDLLSGYSSSRRIEGAQLSEPRFARARSSALGFLRRGDLSDEQRLEEALQIVSEPSENLFGSFVDYARDFYRTSNVISDLEKTAGVQLSADEQAVQKLEDQIAQAEAQMDIMQEQWNTLQGIEAGILSIPEAIANLKEAFGAFQEAQASTGPAPNTSSYSEETYSGFNREQRYLANNLDVLRAIQRGEFASATEHYLLHGQYEGRAFAQGGFHTGGVRMVGEQGPELEMTGPSRIFSHRQTADMFRDPELTNEVRSLRSEVAGLRTENAQLLANNNKYTKRSYDLYRKWDVDGQPPERT